MTDVADLEEAILAEGDWYEYQYEEITEVDLPEFGYLEVVEIVGGGEGSGEHMHIVFKLTCDDGTEEYFKVDGFYSSFGGSEWDGTLYSVTPQQKTITVYN